MYNNKIKKLDNIIEKTLESIKNSFDEINEISDFANDEYIKLEEEFLQLKNETRFVIDKVDQLKKELKKSKAKLLVVNKKYNQYTEQDMKTIYEQTDKLRLELAIQTERETNLIKRRNELELHLKNVKKIFDKSNQMSNNFKMAHDLLSGELKHITQKVDNVKNNSIWGINALQAQELERKRIARDMHDGPTQNLSNLILKTELCIKLLDKDIDRTKLELQSLKLLIRDTIDETRRLIYNLRPMLIDDLGLIPTIEGLVDKVNGNEDFNIEFESSNEHNIQLASIMTLTIYRITQEALNNIKKYSKATKVLISINVNENIIELNISDNGVGFNVDNNNFNYENNRGLGILIMKERTSLLQGEFNLLSEIEKGTFISVKIPIIEEKEGDKLGQDKNINC